MPGRLGPELEQIAAGRQIDDLVRTARHVAREPGQNHQTEHQNDHLDEIGHGHRPHAAPERVDQDRRHADGHAPRNADGTARQQVEHQPQRRDLRRHPAEVAQHDDQRTDDFDGAAIALTVVVADGQQRHAVELGGKEQAHQNQAHARAERVFHHVVQTALDELGRHAQHDLRPEPGREGRGDDHVHRQMATSDREVGGVFHAPGGPQANADGDEQVGNHHEEQHAGTPEDVRG